MTNAELLLSVYRLHPSVYIKQQLGITLTDKQIEIADALPKYKRVMCKSGHGLGKSFIAACLALWHYDCFTPSKTIISAPTQDQIEDVVFGEIRSIRGNDPLLLPKAPRLEEHPQHLIVGYTSRDSNAFQGRHCPHQLVILDEGVGIDGEFWNGAEGMLSGDDNLFFTIFNPTDTSSRAYEEERSGRWHVITASCLDHPNVVLGKTIIPGAVSKQWVNSHVEQWCQKVSEKTPLTFNYSGNEYLPGPEAESRILGRWPSQSSYSIWSDIGWDKMTTSTPAPDGEIEIGADIALFGEDETVICVRRGNTIFHIEAHNGWDTNQTLGRLKELADVHTNGNGQKVPIKIDADGVGSALITKDETYNIIPVHASSSSVEDRFNNKRSELWFTSHELALEGKLHLDIKDEHILNKLRSELFSPAWGLNAKGQRVVEPKDTTKKKIGRSPDLADAFNLCVYTPPRKREFTVF